MRKGVEENKEPTVVEGRLEGPTSGDDLVATDQEIEHVVEQLRDVRRQATFLYVLAIGKVIVDRLYGGSIDEWGKRRSEDTSFRKLASRLQEEEDLRLDAAALSRAVGVYELHETVARDVVTSQHLKANHYIAVLGLELKVAEQLLRKADKHRWSVVQLRKEASKKRDKGSKGGRKPLLPFEKTLNRFGKILDDSESNFAGLEKVELLDAKKADKLFGTLMALGDQVERLKNALRSKTSAYGTASTTGAGDK